MDQRLVAWARAVKARQRRARREIPPLWLFTEEGRMADVAAAVAALPAGLCGVVFRHDGARGRAAMLRRVGLICRERRLALVVAGDRRGAPAWAGWHFRRGSGERPANRFVTSSAHTRAELVRAQRVRVGLVFLSPLFRTESHAGARPLGVMRWSALARRARLPVFALGGVTGATVRLLPRWVAGVGGIGAFLP